MTVQQQTIRHPRTGATPGDHPQPISLETIAVAEQVLTQMLREFRAEVAARAAADAGAIEYDSWLRGARH